MRDHRPASHTSAFSMTNQITVTVSQSRTFYRLLPRLFLLREHESRSQSWTSVASSPRPFPVFQCYTQKFLRVTFEKLRVAWGRG